MTTKPAKLLWKVLGGRTDANIHFRELCGLLRALGFDERIKGSHHIFYRAGVEELVNLQQEDGGHAKAYQVQQVRRVILRYGLSGEIDGEV